MSELPFKTNKQINRNLTTGKKESLDFFQTINTVYPILVQVLEKTNTYFLYVI